MNILYCSTLSSENTLKVLSEIVGKSLQGLTVQKFHRLIVKGLIANNANVTALTVIPYAFPKSSTHLHHIEREDEISYVYVRTTYRTLIIKYFIILYRLIKEIVLWSKNNKDGIIVCDPLNITQCTALFILKPYIPKVVAIITDIPGLMVGNKSQFLRLFSNLQIFIIRKFDGFILLTEAMNEIVNKDRKPFMLMEGLVDANISCENSTDARENNIIYAGALHEEYGVKKLIEAFIKITDDNLRLLIYGAGPMEQDIINYKKQDNRIYYYGLVPNSEVIAKEKSSLLLVNPRPSHYKFAKYSFPSKNMEYMASGTPLLTTKLPGMPDEYLRYVYIFDDESINGMSNKLQEIIYTDNEILAKKGLEAKLYVLQNKNNIKQANRILKFINEL